MKVYKGLVSIVIPVYNQWKYVRSLLESIKEQEYEPIEVIIVDDCSTTGRKTKEKISQKYRVITLKKHRGANYARKRGLQYVKGEYVFFADADSILYSHCIKEMVKALEENEDCVFVYSDFYKICEGEKSLYKSREWNVDSLKSQNYISMMSLIRREVFNEVKFDVSIKKLQDWDLWLTFAEKGYKGCYINEPLFEVYTLKNGISKRLSYKKWYEIVRRKHEDFVNESPKMIWSGSRWISALTVKKESGKDTKKDRKVKKNIQGEYKTDIIIVSRNLEEYTIKALKSIRKNTYRPYRIIWVDNGSTEESRKKVLKELRKHKNWKYIWNSENEGWVGAINQGLQVVNADFVVFMNNDVEVTPGWLGELQDVALSEDDIGLVGPVENRGREGWQRINQLSKWFPEFRDVKENEINKKFKGRYYIVPDMLAFFCVLIKREVIEKIGGLSRKFGKYGLGDDDEFCRRAREAGYKLALAKGCLVYHHHRTTFKAEGIDYVKMQEENLRKLQEEMDSKKKEDKIKNKGGEE